MSRRRQRLMQAASDLFLGSAQTENGVDGGSRDFYVRRLRDWKISVDVETISPRGLVYYAIVRGWTVARAHEEPGFSDGYGYHNDGDPRQDQRYPGD